LRREAAYMRKIDFKLTEEQQKLVEKNHNLIYFVLKKLFLSVEDWYGIVAIGLCKAAYHYDPLRSKFATFACFIMKQEVFMEKRKQRMLRRSGITISLDDIIPCSKGENLTVEDTIPAPDNTEQQVYERILLAGIQRLKPKRQTLIKMTMSGYKQRDIAEAIGRSQPQASRLLKHTTQQLLRVMKIKREDL
jgi:RNA polymerase sigma factor (sigma-70 family)